MSSSPLKRGVRASTAPFRNFFNDHFEMVKDEVRRNASGDWAGGASGDAHAWKRVAELENNLAEQALHQARILNRLTEDIEHLTTRIDDLDRVVRQLADVVAATSRRD